MSDTSTKERGPRDDWHRPNHPGRDGADPSITPGPWMAYEDDHGRMYIVAGGNNYVAELRKPAIGNKVANGRLMAASPQLLEALRATTSMLQSACLVIKDAEARQMALSAVRDGIEAIYMAGGDPCV